MVNGVFSRGGNPLIKKTNLTKCGKLLELQKMNGTFIHLKKGENEGYHVPILHMGF